MSTHVCPPNMDHSRDLLAQNRHNPLTTSSSSSSYSLSSAPNRFFGPETKGLSQTAFKSTKKNVARNLFGPPDPKSTQYARQKVLEMRDRDTQRWNFDFDKEKPLEGRYKWEAMSLAAEGRHEDSSSGEVPRAYALSRLPFLSSSSTPAQYPSTSAVSSSDAHFSRNVSDRGDPLLIVLESRERESMWGVGGAAGGTASDVGGGSGSGESEGEERDGRSLLEPPRGSSASVGTSLTRSSSQESQSVSSASSQYSFPSPNRSPPVQIDPLTIPIPSPPEDCSSSCSSSTSLCDSLPLSEPSNVTLQSCENDCKVRLKKRTAKQSSLKDYMPVKRRSSSQATGAPEKKTAM